MGLRWLGISTGSVVLLFWVLSATASAAAPEFLLRIANDRVLPGNGAAQLAWPSAIVGSPSSGHVFITEAENERISEYTAWGLFVKSWGWGVADGSPELQTCGPVTPEASPPSSICRAGVPGAGKGQMLAPSGIAMDPGGNLYVFERLNLRVQKFSPSGEFLVMFGGDVNKTKVEEGAPAAERNRCPIAPGDVCQTGTAGSGPESFAANLIFDGIEYSSAADAILVGDEGRIQEFNVDGSFKSQISFEGALEPLKNKIVRGLNVDSAGNIYFTLVGVDNVYKLNSSGEPMDPGKPGASSFDAQEPRDVAVDVEGNVYTVVGGAQIYEFSEAGARLVPTKTEEDEGALFPFTPAGGQLFGLATNLCVGSEAPGDLYAGVFDPSRLGFVDAFGSGPTGCEPPPLRPPLIKEQYAASVGTSVAKLRANINPRFFKDTTYFVEFGPGRCAEGGCNQFQPLPPGSILTSKVLNKFLLTPTVTLSGLESGRTYHYRFVAKSTGGGPVFGVDPDGEAGPKKATPEEGLEGTFRTFPLPSAAQPCPANEALRSGSSGTLPDCRAYELVSPLDKGNGDAALLPGPKVFHELNQSTPSGDRFTYSSITPFADPESAPFVNQLLAQRDPVIGWVNEEISPPRAGRALELTRSLNNDFKAFSEDLCMGWLRHNSTSILAPEATPGFPNLYRRENCTSPPSYEALSTAEPPSRPAIEYLLYPLGFSEDGTKSFFVANDRLTEDAPALKPEELSLYVHSQAGGLRYVCYLPDGSPNPTACGAGLPAAVAGQHDGSASAVQNAVSNDGSRVFWTAYKGDLGISPEGFSGRLYVRLNADREESAGAPECTEPQKACTIAVSESVSAEPAVSKEPAQFWAASNDGSKAIFKVTDGPLKGNLYEFDVDSKAPRLIAQGVEGPMGISDDVSDVYFSSSKALAPGGIEGAHNLYHYEAGGSGGSINFVMGLAGADLNGSELSPGAVNEVPTERSSAVSRDGSVVAFSSAASPGPTGYDNTDVESGRPDDEVYVYDATGAGELRCVSCNPTNARPAGTGVLGPAAAARLSPPKTPLHSPHTLSADGNRLFFESHEALVPRDVNGTWDVYQWEAPGTGGCDEGDSTFGKEAGGCVDLISSGESPAPSRFLDADADGSDVFISTQSSLIATDFGSNDVYDARVEGGFPLPTPKASCEGEACQSPPAPPAVLTPASSSFKGQGNQQHKRCPKGTRKIKHRGKARCRKRRHRHHHKKRTHKTGRAAK